MCKHNDSRDAEFFGVSSENEFYCEPCAQAKRTGKVFPMEFYDIARRLGLSEFQRRLENSAVIRVFVESLKNAERATQERTKTSVEDLSQTLQAWIEARNHTFAEWIERIEKESKACSSGKTASDEFQDVLTLITSENAEPEVLRMLYDLNPLLDQLQPYQAFKGSTKTCQSEEYVQQLSELRLSQPTRSVPAQSQQPPRLIVNLQSTRLAEPIRRNDYIVCKNNDSYPAKAFGVSSEDEFYCRDCAQSKPTGTVFPMEFYDLARSVGFSEFERRLENSSIIRDFIESLSTSERGTRQRTKERKDDLVQTLEAWIKARNVSFTEWIERISKENEEYRHGQEASKEFQDVLTLITLKNAESEVLHSLYDLTPLLDQLPPYKEFRQSSKFRQLEIFVQQISELCSPQPLVEPEQPLPLLEPSDSLPVWYPLLSRSVCMRWDLNEKRLERVEVQGPNVVFSESVGVVYVEGSKYFFCGCGTSKRQAVLFDFNTGIVEMFPDLNRERDSCGLVHYKGFIYIFGGYGGSQYGLTRSLAISAPSLSVERLSLSTPQYQDRTDMPHPRYGFSAARYGQKVYLAGGWNSERSIDVYDLLVNSFTTLPDAIAFDRVSCACVVGEDLVVFTQDIMKKWRINESGRGQMEDIRLSTSVDDLWSNLTPINTTEGVICVQFPTFKLYTLNVTTGSISTERLRQR